MRAVDTLPAATPIRLSPDRRAELSAWLTQEIEDALSARHAIERTWRDSLRLYEAVPKLERRSTPVENAPNIEVPLAATACDSIYAQATDLIYNVSPILTVRATTARSVQPAKTLQTWVNWMATHELDLRASDHALLDDIQLGTGILSIPWQERRKKTRVHRVVWQGPALVPIPPEDFLVPGGVVPDLQRTRFVAVRVWLSRTELTEQAKAGRWTVGEAQPCAGLDAVRQSRERVGRTYGQAPSRMGDLFEIWHVDALYDLDDDGIDEDVRIVWDRTSRSVLRVRYHPYDRRPYVAMRYQLRPHLFYGLGVIEMLRPFQEEETELHNHRTLNVMLANARVWAGRQGQVSDTMTIWPSKVIQLQNPKEDLVALQMADVYPSIGAAEAVVISLAERRVGVNDLTQPRPSNVLGSRTPGITALSMLQQATKRFAPAFDGMRLGLAAAVQQAVYRYQERLLSGGTDETDARANLVRVLGQADAEAVVRLLKDEHFDEAVSVELTASSAAANREADRQNAILLANLMTTYYERILQLASVAANPQLPPELREVARKIAHSAGELADRTLRTFDQVRDPLDLIVDLDAVLHETERQSSQQHSGLLASLLSRLSGPARAASSERLEPVGLEPAVPGAGEEGGNGGPPLV